MAIPNPLWRPSLLVPFGLIFAILLAPAIYVAICLVAYWNYMDIAGRISCSVGLLFDTLLLWGWCYGLFEPYEHISGFRRLRVGLLSCLAYRHFLECAPTNDGTVEIRYGFRLFGRSHITITLPLHEIENVHLSPGQAPQLWHLWIKCHHPDLKYGIVQIGPERHVDETEPFGLAVVEFLRRAGANLVEGDDESTYVRAPSPSSEATLPPDA